MRLRVDPTVLWGDPCVGPNFPPVLRAGNLIQEGRFRDGTVSGDAEGLLAQYPDAPCIPILATQFVKGMSPLDFRKTEVVD
jgi:hypothetical protein